MNDLRSRIRVQTDGKLQTGRDVAIAALLGAEEFGFSTAPLIAMGCIMMRKCHLNTCPVGIATQDPELRTKFQGTARARDQLFLLRRRGGARDPWPSWASARSTRWSAAWTCSDAAQGHRSLEGQGPRPFGHPLQSAGAHRAWRAAARRRRITAWTRRSTINLIEHAAERDRERERRSSSELPIRNVHRTVGAMLSGEIARRVRLRRACRTTPFSFDFNGSAGQSFGAFLAKGVTLTLEGDANDYVGKGLSGGRLIVYPPRNVQLPARRKHPDRQRRALRRHQRRGLLQRHGRRAVRRAQFRRDGRGRRRRRSRLRIHDQRPGRRARPAPAATSPPA